MLYVTTFLRRIIYSSHPIFLHPDLAAKCISRKSRCTFVKFHRQTAPSGPGHHRPRSPSSLSSSIGSSRLPYHLDNFVLAPPPSALPVTSAPFTGSDQIFNTPFTFNPAAHACAPNWTAADLYQLPTSMASEPDMAAKYRAQTDFVRRTGPPMLPTMPPGLYGTQQHQPPSSNLYSVWGDSGTLPPLDDTKSFDGIARTHSLASSEPTSFAPDFYGGGFVGSAYRPRRESLDLSDSSSATSQSVPSSASSSSVHLPLSVNEMCDARSEEMQTHEPHILQPSRSNSMPAPHASFHDDLAPQQPHRTEGGFFSAFGHMSIDDPNVLAGLSSDGVLFFSNLSMGVLPHSPNATPMPTRMQHPHLHQGRDRVMSLGALPTTPGLTKDAADTRELKDMWRTYLRSPLSGSGTATLDVSTSPPQLPQSPSGQRRRMRVSSLPSVTPTVEKGHPLMMNGGHGELGGGGSTLRATLHGNPEDLRSYEAAVNARSAALKLNLVPRRKGTRPTMNGSSPRVPGASSPGVGQTDQDISRPSSSSSTSSLAQAFTLPHTPHPQHHAHHHAHLSHAHVPVVKSPPMQGASISLPSMSLSGLHSNHHGHGHLHSHHAHSVALGSSTSLPFEPGSRSSSVTSDGTGTGESGSDGEAFRPSFKRYPSQTLVPASSKRALVERGGGKSTGVKVNKGGLKEEARDEVRKEADFDRVGVRAGVGSRPIAALPERAKRG